MPTFRLRLPRVLPFVIAAAASSCTHYAGVMRSYEKATIVAGTEEPAPDAVVALDLQVDDEQVVKGGILTGRATAKRVGTAEYEIAAHAVDAIDPWTPGEAFFVRLIAVPFYLGFLAPLWSNEVADYGGDGHIGAGDRLLDLVHTLNPLMAWPGRPHEEGDDHVVRSRRERRPADLATPIELELMLKSHRGTDVMPVPLDSSGAFRLDLLPALDRLWDDDLVGELRVKGTATVASVRSLAWNARQYLAANHRLEPLEWMIACEADTRAAYARFAAQHAGSGHAADVTARLQELAWREARTADTRTAYVAIGQAWPSHPRIAEARARIDEIDWQRAAAADAVVAYTQYLALQPEGAYVDAARRRAAHLQLAHDWRLAEGRSTPAAYRTFAAAHPDVPEAATALQRIAALEQHAEGWLAACKVGTTAAFEDYKKRNPTSPYAATADRALLDLAGRDLGDLLDEGKIEVKSAGESIRNVGVEVRRLVPYPIRVNVPVGTFFCNDSGAAQNMVATGPATVELNGDDWERVLVPSACANRPRPIPGSGDTFTVQRSASSAELVRLMAVLADARVDYATEQAAVWIVTDDASYADLGHLVSRPVGAIYGGSRVIGAPEAARAMQLCAKAGIDIDAKAIVGDRDTIANELPDGELKAWLAARVPAPKKR